MRVERHAGGYRLAGDWAGIAAANAFLGHLDARAFAPATVRAYAYDLLNFGRFATERRIALADLVPTDVFDWLDWQRPPRSRTGTVVAFGVRCGAAPASVNRRVAALRAFFEHQVLADARTSNPVPAPRRGAGLRPKARGPLGHLGPGRTRGGGRLVREIRRLPESLDPADVGAFLADLATHRDRAIVWAMVLGGLRAGEVRGLRLADVDQGRHRVRVIGKGGRERVVPIDRAFFTEIAAYLRQERPPGITTPECFVVLRGPTAGRPLTEAGLRSLFRHPGSFRCRPGAAPSPAPHLRHRARRGRDRPARPSCVRVTELIRVETRPASTTRECWGHRRQSSRVATSARHFDDGPLVADLALRAYLVADRRNPPT